VRSSESVNDRDREIDSSERHGTADDVRVADKDRSAQ
jgi:hypothetical protein